MLYDITRRISPGTPVWPGDHPYHPELLLRIAEGAAVNLTTLTLSAHTGTHADAYYHYNDAGARAADMPLNAFLGPARVVTVHKVEGPLLPSDFATFDLAGGQRLLIHSQASEMAEDDWPERIVYLSVELIEWLAELGYVLIGLDTPSVDAYDSKALPCHHALLRHGLVNLENLYLRGVPDGDYELIALPLKLDMACGSPLRAVLRTID